VRDDDGENFLVEFDEFIVVVAADDREQQCIFDEFLFLFDDLFLFRVPAQFQVVF
jgi:hypothetical protein